MSNLTLVLNETGAPDSGASAIEGIREDLHDRAELDEGPLLEELGETPIDAVAEWNQGGASGLIFD